MALSIAAPCFADGPTLQQAIADYNNRKYSESLNKLRTLQANGQQNNDTVHYYMGLSYQGVNQIAAAKQEYAWVVQASRNPQLRSNAQTALASIDRWSQNRNYQGQGNDFARGSTATATVMRSSGGGG